MCVKNINKMQSNNWIFKLCKNGIFFFFNGSCNLKLQLSLSPNFVFFLAQVRRKRIWILNVYTKNIKRCQLNYKTLGLFLLFRLAFSWELIYSFILWQGKFLTPNRFEMIFFQPTILRLKKTFIYNFLTLLF